MKKMLKRMLCITLCVVIGFSLLTACSKEKEETQPTSETPSKAEATDGATTDDVVELTVFIDHTWYDTDQFTGIIPEEITAQTGVRLVPIKAVDAMQLGVMVASNDLPDLIYTSQLGDRLSNPNISYAYNELIEQYAPDFKPSEDQITVAKSMATDGNYYTILNASSTQEEWRNASAGSPTLASLIYRKDILDELGMEMNTLEDYKKVLGAVKEKYSDMVPLTMEVTFMVDFFKSNIIPGWVPTTQGMVEAEGNKIIHQTSVPEYKDFLKYMNDLYRNGYINPDNFAFTDGTQSEELCTNNKAFSMSFMTGDRDTTLTRDLNANGYEGNFEHALPMSDLSYVTPGTGWSGVYITKNNKNPEASIKLMQWMFSEEGQRVTQWGRKDIEYTLDDKGVPQFSKEWLQARSDGTLTSKYNPNYYFGISGVVEAIGRASGISESANAAMDKIRNNLKVALVPNLVNPKSDTPESIRMSQVAETVKNYETKIYLSNSDEEFEANVAELYDRLEKLDIKGLEAYYTTQGAEYYK
jgi:putative aldouronate transport system substrate-binding protein